MSSSDFKCDACGSNFTNFDGYDAHMAMCEITTKVSNVDLSRKEAEIEVKNEVKNEVKKEEYMCDLCKKLYKTKKGYDNHKCAPPKEKKATPSNSDEKQVPPKEEEAKEEVVPPKEEEAKEEPVPVKEEEKKEPASHKEENGDFICSACTRGYKTKKGLDNHKCKPSDGTEKKRTRKPKEPKEDKPKFEEVCGKCKKTFKTQKGLDTHVCVEKFEPTTCEKCQKVFKVKKTFETHECELLECKACDKVFQNKFGYNRHIESSKCKAAK